MTGSPDVHGYHIHVYYDENALPAARTLHRALADRFPIQVGALLDAPVGPHPISQFAAIFTNDRFQSVVTWLMMNRQGLNILIHPLTDDMVDDHSVYAIWLGEPVALKLDTMQRRGYGAALLPAPVSPT